VAAALLDLFGEESPEHRAVGTPSACAGLLLLVRTVHHAHLHSAVERLGLPEVVGLSSLAAVLAPLGLAWGGAPALERGRSDPAVSAFAGLAEPPAQGEIAPAWARVTASDLGRLQLEIARTLAANQLLESRVPRLELLELESGERAAVLAAGTDGIAAPDSWLFGTVIHERTDLASSVLAWLDAWGSITGTRPETVECDPAGLPLVGGELASAGIRTRAVPGSGEELEGALASMGSPETGNVDGDLTVALVATSLLRTWARWLRGFGDSSVAYLLDELVRRPGVLFRDGEVLTVLMEPRPLDIVLEMAGYLSELSATEIGIGRLRFRVSADR
jgi:hypothetical protein